MITVEKQKSTSQFPLRKEDLCCGQFAEANNGTFVLCIRVDMKLTIINIVNGLGAYPEYCRYRLITESVITLVIDNDGRAEKE